MALLEIDNLQVVFSGASALSGISMALADGESVAVLGANGAGKSTLLKALMGRAPVSGGSVRLDDEDITGLPTDKLVRRGLSLCPEARQLFPAMSIQDNLLLGAYLAPAREGKRRLTAIYERFPWLHERRTDLANAFSGGEQQMVAIGRALMAAPRVLLMDEPSSGLSPVAIAQVRDVLQQVRRNGTVILLVEQNVQLAIDMCERCYVLNRGTIEATGPTPELAQDPALADAYMGGLAR